MAAGSDKSQTPDFCIPKAATTTAPNKKPQSHCHHDRITLSPFFMLPAIVGKVKRVKRANQTQLR
jgi:hypothetical protein